jgi:hypothetical protein
MLQHYPEGKKLVTKDSIVRFYLHEILRIGTFINTENMWGVVKGKLVFEGNSFSGGRLKKL